MIHGAVLLAVMVFWPRFEAVIIATVLIVLSGVTAMVQCRHIAAVKKLLVDDEGLSLITSSNQGEDRKNRIEIDLRPLVLNFLLIIPFRVHDESSRLARDRYLILLSDSCSHDDFRQLRVYFRHRSGATP